MYASELPVHATRPPSGTDGRVVTDRVRRHDPLIRPADRSIYPIRPAAQPTPRAAVQPSTPSPYERAVIPGPRGDLENARVRMRASAEAPRGRRITG